MARPGGVLASRDVRKRANLPYAAAKIFCAAGGQAAFFHNPGPRPLRHGGKEDSVIRGPAMLSHVRRWIVVPLVTLIAASFVLYTAVWLQPGDPLTVLLDPKVSPVQYRYLALKLGLDRPMPVRYWDWLTGAVHGNFGTSLVYKQSVASLIEPRLPTTLLLVAYTG